MEASIFLVWLLLVSVDAPLTLLLKLWRRLTGLTRSNVHKKDVVIVGASFGGLAVKRELAGRRDLDVTLVDFKDYFEYTPGILRCFIDPDYLGQLTCPLPRCGNRLAIGEVFGVSPTAVSIRRPDDTTYELSFDYLVLACGSTYQEPIKPIASERSLSQRQASFRTAHSRLRLSEKVIIVGAGAVGVELAGEILTEFPRKRVMLVDMAPTVLPGFPPRCAEHALRWLRRMGVELRLGQAIAEINTESIALKTGEVLDAGIVYKCVGVMPNTSMMKNTAFASALGFRDSVNVNDNLQIAGYSNIFCVGDMMSHSSRELKLGHTAEVNGHLAAHNVGALAAGGAKLLEYPEGVVGAATTPKIFCLSLGRYDASLGFNWLVLNGWLPALVKWLLEWTKVAAAGERPVGVLFWRLADALSLWLGRRLIRGS